ncbi:MAG: hypothetical protein AAB131_04860 [Actinomycetota bacterium]|jgi:hypothetical protein|nr:MAG: hypothetical protein FD127_833 [Acidimicrobiaceae bacterium]
METTGFGLFVMIVQVVAAIGILAFWQTASSWPMDEPWRPPGFALHERCFRVPDTVCALLLIAAAVLTWRDVAEGRSLALVAAGMLLFLGVIDATYMFQNGLFARERDGRMHAAIVILVLGVATLLLIEHIPAPGAA